VTEFRAGSLLAGYRLESQVGAGGMAVVFRARDERLNRLVALKILAPALASDPGFRSRFIAESRAAAAVDDPYIIPVYEAGEDGGVLFIAMRFVQGGDLYRVLEREGALPPDRAAEFVSPVASALDAAHRAGLVHRDVKPANILVDTREDRPDHVYLSDFGVSKAIASAGLTGPGHFVGTADYSAPEQIQGRAVDGRTDQYALACVTFQLLTGTLPFRPDQGTPVLVAHLSVPPPSLVARKPDLPAAVDQVLAKAMAKAPEKRYGSCREFAVALRESLSLAPFDPQGSATPPADPPSTLPSETVTQRAAGTTAPPSAPRPRRSRRRLPALALACAILAATGVIAFVLESPAKSLKHANSPRPAKSVSAVNSPSYRRTHLALPAPYANEVVSSLAFNNTGTTLAIADLYICLWDIATSRCATDSAIKNAGWVAFSPDGKTLAVGRTLNTDLLNVATRSITAVFTDPGSKGVQSAAFSPDGRTLAVGDYNGHSYLWNVVTGKLQATLADPGSKGVKPVAFSPDGRILAAGDFNGRTYLWNVATGRLAATLADPSGKNVNAVAFSPDGRTLATGDFNGHSYLWDITTKELATTFSDPGSDGVNSLAFSPDGKILAVADEDQQGYLWDVTTKALVTTLIDASSISVNVIAFSPRDNTLVTGDESGGVSLWRSG